MPPRSRAALGLLLAGSLAAAAVAWPAAAPARPVEVSGRVRAQGGGVEGAGVTDGVALVRTAPDGSFRLASRTGRVLRLCGPHGETLSCATELVPCLVRRVRADENGRMRARFDLGPARLVADR